MEVFWEGDLREIERRKASSIKEELEKSKKKRDKLVEDRKKRLAKKVKEQERRRAEQNQTYQTEVSAFN